MSLEQFHPAARSWFTQSFGVPTEAQAQAWPAIKSGAHTLIAAPTGSGKTLAAFYAAIDDLVWQAQREPLPELTRVLYISPLKALGNDIHRNLEVPLAGIAEELLLQGASPANIQVGVRSGDTTASERQRMTRKPPHILVTTPESLYLLLTSRNGRRMLASVRTVILDEIHALLGDKRGSHLALSLERLQALCEAPLQRIGLSATQKPIEMVSRYLTGNGALDTVGGRTPPECVVIDSGHRRALDVSIEVPGAPLTALMSNEVWEELYERLVQLIDTHQTTLVFVNTRRLSERLALALSERLDPGTVSSHHGSMSKEHRHSAEQRLKQGQLKVLVATASMELGIDIGSVDLVVQFSSPKSIATFLQRVGRSGHSVGGTPKGIMFPLTRDDLIECTAVLDSVQRGELDRILMPEKPLDILAQQIVAELAARQESLAKPAAATAGDADDTAIAVIDQDPQDEQPEGPAWDLDELFELMGRAYPYRDVTRQEFDALVKMLADGYSTRLGRRGAYLHLDRINGRVSARRNARLVALTNGGAIPDMFDYQVVLDPEDTVVGSLNEDFALETLPGDIFTLGSHSWQLIRVDGLKVRVRDAQDMKPTVPFWLGEARGRSRELSQSVSRLRQNLDDMIVAQRCAEAMQWLTQELGLPASAAQQLLDYLQAGRNALQVMPTQQTLVMERFFDEVGDMHLVIHSPFGSRLNKAWGLALRKRFCRNFNFELQAAATEDSIVISLGSVHSFPLQEVFNYLHSASVEDVLIQALLDAPMFEVRWRWNATRSLAIQRNRSGRRVPPQFQRMDAEDLVAQVFPDQLACFENIQGKREVPDHPLVQQTIQDCLTEAMDLPGLLELLQTMESGQLQLVALDLREPSPFAQEIINARPYAFLDDAPFEERRTNAIRNRSWLDPSENEGFSVLDPAAVAQVREEAWPLVRNAEELHDALYSLACMTEAEVVQRGYLPWLQQLEKAGRATWLQAGDIRLCLSAERIPCLRAALPGGALQPVLQLPAVLEQESWERPAAIQEVLRRRLEGLGPVTAQQLAGETGLPLADVDQALLALEAEGFVFRGSFETPSGGEGSDAVQWCERRLLQRIHRYTIDAHRQSIKPVSLQAYAHFLFKLHEIRPFYLAPRPVSLPSAAEGQAILQRSVERLDGLAAPAASWEADIFPGRMSLYDPSWLDVLCVGGRVVWGRYTPPVALGAARSGRRHSAGPIKTTPITLAMRANNELWVRLSAAQAGLQDVCPPPLSSAAERIAEDLRQHGASFFSDISQRTGLLHSQLEQGLAELVSSARLSSDSYTGLRALLTPDARKPGGSNHRGRRASFGVEDAGRWSLLQTATAQQPTAEPAPRGEASASSEPILDNEQLERLIMIYLQRWGVLFRQVLERETSPPPWRTLLHSLKRMELRGLVRGGRFIAGIGGEQFALPEAVSSLRDAARQLSDAAEASADDWSEERNRQLPLHSLSAADPVNLLNIFLPEQKLGRLAKNRVLYRNGIPIAALESGKLRFLREVPSQYQWQIQQLLTRREIPPQLRRYLGSR